jgi:hypothetical protein
MRSRGPRIFILMPMRRATSMAARAISRHAWPRSCPDRDKRLTSRAGTRASISQRSFRSVHFFVVEPRLAFTGCRITNPDRLGLGLVTWDAAADRRSAATQVARCQGGLPEFRQQAVFASTSSGRRRRPAGSGLSHQHGRGGLDQVAPRVGPRAAISRSRLRPRNACPSKTYARPLVARCRRGLRFFSFSCTATLANCHY